MADDIEVDDRLSHQQVRVADYGEPDFGEIIDVRERPHGDVGQGSRLVIGCVAAFSSKVEDGIRTLFIDPVPERTRPDLVAYVETKPHLTERVRDRLRVAGD